MAKYIVATVDEIPPGGRKIVDIASRSVGIFNIGGDYFALLNRCPHQAGPLCEGRLAGFLQSSTPGEYIYSRQGEILRCPWHGWEYDIRTGQSWFDPAQVRVRAYKAGVEPGSALADDDTVVVASTPRSFPATADGAAPPGMQQGPYVAETYPVSVDQQYVVIEIQSAVRSRVRSTAMTADGANQKERGI